MIGNKDTIEVMSLTGVACVCLCVCVSFYTGYMDKVNAAKIAEQSSPVQYAREDNYDEVVKQVTEGTVSQAIVVCNRYGEMEALKKINQDGLKIVGTIVRDGNTMGFIVEKGQ